jgi:membrane-bound metal-dependent hydrolase YbcI (DUF457 family)
MDPISHAAFGRALVALDGRRALGAGAVAACVIGSLGPDVDLVLAPYGWDTYLRVHQGGTHSLIGSAACAALTAAVVRLLWKQGRYPVLWAAAWIGALGHLFLDLVSGADIRFLWPTGPPVALPLFAMADPWLGGTLVLGLVTLRFSRRNPSRVGVAILAAVAVLVGAKAMLYSRTRAIHDSSPGLVQFRRAEAQWGSLTRWTVYETRADTVSAYRVDALSGGVTPLVQLPRRLNDPLVVRSRELGPVRNLLASHGVTFATVSTASDDRSDVLWSDLRYCRPSSGSTASCALWFGGEFDPRADAFTVSVVRAYGFVQHRRGIR